jgi:cell filamentation protein
MEHDRSWDNYFYPGTNVFRNNLNIRNHDDLFFAERDITSLTLAYVRENPVRGCFDFVHLCLIHKTIFGDLYPWAGLKRTVNISKSNPFVFVRLLDIYAEENIFLKLKEERFLTDVDPNEIIPKLTYYFNEINILHPFRDGNGRTQRVFIEYLAQIAGYSLGFEKVSPEENVKACVDAFYEDYRSMHTMFERITEPILPDEKRAFHELMGYNKESNSFLQEDKLT